MMVPVGTPLVLVPVTVTERLVDFPIVKLDGDAVGVEIVAEVTTSMLRAEEVALRYSPLEIKLAVMFSLPVLLGV